MKKLICILLILIFTVTSAGALVYDGQAPYFGSYLFLYNASDSVISVAPLASTSTQSSLAYSWMEDGEAEEAVQVEWSPEREISRPNGHVCRDVPASKSGICYSVTSSAEPQIGDRITYLVSNPKTGEQYYQDFIYLVAGDYCNILVESDVTGAPKISAASAQTLATEFDTNIQPFMVENFGDYYTYIGLLDEYTLQYSKNTGMDILLYDIQDGYNGTTVKNYVGGFVDLTDLISADLGGNGNGRGILHIDIYPLMGTTGTPNVTKAYSTIVHEFQHQISYSDSLYDFFIGLTDEYINETWWNEAFSMAAEHLYGGKPLASRINGYNQVGNNSPLRNGMILNYNDYAENNSDVASNYGISYLFGQYLRCQTKYLPGGGNQIYRTILEQVGTDYTAILQGLYSIGYDYVPATLEELYRNFRMATILKYPTGPYGFAGEEAFDGLIDNAYTGTATIRLKPRAAVVLKNPRNYVPETGLSCVAFTERGPYSYAINPVSDMVVNLTEGERPECGVTLYAAGYRADGSLCGITIPTAIEDEDNWVYILPSDTVSRKFFLVAADGSMRPFAYAETR